MSASVFTPLEVAPYRVVKLLCARADAAVQLALDATGTLVVLKCLRLPARMSNQQWRERCEKLAEVTRASSGLLALLAHGMAAPGIGFYVLPAADDASGDAVSNPTAYQPLTLRSRLRVGGRLPAEEVATLARNLGEALLALHAAGFTHADVKPGNICLIEGRACLGDYDSLLNDHGGGTEGFRPPDGSSDQSADVYALGKTVYEAFSGLDRLEFPSLPRTLLRGPEWRKTRRLNALVIQACAPLSSERFPSADEWLRSLGEVSKPKTPARQPQWLLLGAVLVTGIAAALFWKMRLPPQHLVSGPQFVPVDLRAFTNAFLDQTWQHGAYGIREDGTVVPNHLGALKPGRQVLGGVTYEVQGVVQLNSSRMARDPRNHFPVGVTNIPVGRVIRSLHFLHACTFRAGPKEVIGRYRIHFADGSAREMELIFGGNLADWWRVLDGTPPTNGPAVVWTGENSVARRFNSEACLYGSVWTNSQPSIPVRAIDVISDMGPAAPVIIGITAEAR